jgi:autotransporter family porin
VGGHFSTLAVGAALPSGAWCASQVRSAPEIRADNAGANATRGTTSNDRYPRVDGDFVGTTDEIIQWAACKWGIDEDVARAQAAKESWWHNSVGGDLTWDQNACHVDLQTPPGSQCPESIGLLQVRWLYHMEAFEDSNTILSTAYNADYTYAVWRDCYDGNLTWLNDVERGGWYEAGDVDGCLGVWFSGRWYTQPAVDYIAAVNDYLSQRIWEQAWFING